MNSWNYLLVNQNLDEGEVHKFPSNCQFDYNSMTCKSQMKCKNRMMPKYPLKILQNSCKILKED